MLREDFDGRILPFDSVAARACVVIAAARRPARGQDQVRLARLRLFRGTALL